MPAVQPHAPQIAGTVPADTPKERLKESPMDRDVGLISSALRTLEAGESGIG